MSSINIIDVNGVKYNMAQAPADKQKSLLLIVGKSVALNTAITKQSAINIALLKGALLALPEREIDKIAEIVLYKTVRQSDPNDVITVSDFQGKINDYLTILAEGIKVNLQDFFMWLDSVNIAGGETRPE